MELSKKNLHRKSRRIHIFHEVLVLLTKSFSKVFNVSTWMNVVHSRRAGARERPGSAPGHVPGGHTDETSSHHIGTWNEEII